MLELLVNGSRHRVETDADESLLTALRDRLDLTGTKVTRAAADRLKQRIVADPKARLKNVVIKM